MTEFTLNVLKDMRKILGRQGKVLEIGSLNVNGTARDSFGDADKYIGIDLVDGDGVDIVMNAHDLKKHFKKGEFDCVICCETLEHDCQFWKTLEGVRWVIKKGGVFIVTVPGTAQKYHHPPDYYRFYPDAFPDAIFDGFNNLSIQVGFPKKDMKKKTLSEAKTINAYGFRE